MFKLAQISTLILSVMSGSVIAQEPIAADESASVQPSPSPVPQNPGCVPGVYVSPFEGDLWDRSNLLGSVGGTRDQLAAAGIGVNVYSTQFYQGVASGGLQQQFAYNGRMDYLVNVDGEKAGLWQGLFVTLHGETRYGDQIGLSSGALMPFNTAALFPQPTGTVSALTAVKFTQALSENFITFAGKINMLDELKQPYSAGRGVDAFMNLGLTLPVAAARTVPYSTLGAGFAVLRDMQPFFTMMVLDTNNTPTTSGFESFFNNGATILTRIETPVTFLDLPGHQALWGTYSSGTYSDLSPTPYFDPVSGLKLISGTQTGSWSIVYSADQALYVDPGNPNRSWGVFTNVGLADNGPSPIRWSVNVGLGGSSPIQSRPRDTFGIGYAYVNYSSPVQQLAPVVLPIGNDHVVELFYNIAVTPWFHLTPDLQVLTPARERTLPPGPDIINTAIVLGLRAKIDF
ncbi:MAG: carbohydrate porin [Planctomycetes bacterium]|nr:carbohydrate porin [Planctomycetota bacterium]